MSEYILEMKNITKKFPGVIALDNVNLKVKKGEIHSVVGENGAGKSTLMKVLSGVYPIGTYEGDILINGQKQEFKTISDSEKVGVSIIYQELALVKILSIEENIFLGNEFFEHGKINWSKTHQEAVKLLAEVGLSDNPGIKVKEIGIGKQQLVEIAKALSKKIKILILDEPTASLNETDTANLLGILKELRNKGVTCIYISHKLNEILEISDSVTIIRDGNTITTRDMHNEKERLTEDTIISNMVGRKLTQRFPDRKHDIGEVIFEVKNWTVNNPDIPDTCKLSGINLKLHKGEILGVAGLMGAGRTELAMSLIGAYGIKKSGELFIEGKEVNLKTPRDAIRNGISYSSEDRKGIGLILMMDIKTNITLPGLNLISKLNTINANEEIKRANEYVDTIGIKTPSIEQKAGNLSGGNQQKVAIAKSLMTKPKIIIMDEPTRGIDVGAKYEIFKIMSSLVEQGVSIIMISSELPEILGMSDRILVMENGKFTGELSNEDATQEKVMFYATGGK